MHQNALMFDEVATLHPSPFHSRTRRSVEWPQQRVRVRERFRPFFSLWREKQKNANFDGAYTKQLLIKVFVGRYGAPQKSVNNNNKMTVNDFKETACATVQPIVEDMEVEGEVVIGSYDHEENLLGRVLAGKSVIKWAKQSFIFVYL